MRFGKLLFLFLYFLGFNLKTYAQISSEASSSPRNRIVETTGLKSSKPEAVGINGKILTEKIDAIVLEAIREEATPGAVVAIVKDNQVIFEKAYGYHTYENKVETKVDDLFDLASISKIAATTLAVMHLIEEGKINLNETLGHYLEDTRNTNKANLRLKDVMLHQAGLIPFIPFHRDLKPEDHRPDSTAAFPIKVVDGFYLRKNYFNEIMWPQVLNSPIRSPGKYAYSDLSMYVMQKVIEKQSKISLDEYVKDLFYDKLGMNSTGYNPWKNYPLHRIVPTERDGKSFRDTLLIGFVHDQGAAMASGVAGHAGLFSTVGDLAIYGQLLLNRGSYGGLTFFKPETIDLFTSKQTANSRRGLGFDRFDPDRSKEYPSRLATPATYGHTGYTGTCIWIDPDNQLVYVFLSNRIHPKVSNKLSSLNIRSRILDAVYEGINE
jgi:CubicO group peptidase (beta-lactamase class C family)